MAYVVLHPALLLGRANYSLTPGARLGLPRTATVEKQHEANFKLIKYNQKAPCKNRTRDTLLIEENSKKLLLELFSLFYFN